MWLVAAAAVGGLIWLDPLTPSRSTAKPPTDAGVVDGEPVDAAPAIIPPEIVDAPSTPRDAPLYTVTEAFEDIASGPLVFIGTGEWFGNFSIHGCAYRNRRVIVVYQYCTVREQPALGLTVISPSRGHLNIYAEGETPISTSPRTAWNTFRVETEPTTPGEPASLDFTYPDLRAWDERRYNAHVGACWSGEGDRCSTSLEASLEAWLPSAKEFLAAPPDAFYRLVKDLHARGARDSRRAK